MERMVATVRASGRSACVAALAGLSLCVLSPASVVAQTIDTYSGGGPTGPIESLQANLYYPTAVTADAVGNWYIAVPSAQSVYKVAPDGTLTRVAGTGFFGFSGDGGPATSASLSNPQDVAVDAAGNLFIADTNNHRIRRVTPTGVISTIAGIGTFGFNGDDRPATSASLRNPHGVAVDAAGNVLIADTINQRIRRVTPAGVISTIAGNGTAGYSGEGGPAASANLRFPNDVAVDAAGNLYIVDGRVLKVSPDGTLTRVAGGTGPFGFGGDGGPANFASLSSPQRVAIDGPGNLYIADTGNQRIRRVTSSGVIDTIAGNGTFGFAGDGGPAIGASLNSPYGVAVDGTGNVLIADTHNRRIRRVTPSGVISTIAGNGTFGFSGDGGPATSASHYGPNGVGPAGVATDSAGNLYISDPGNLRIRRVTPTGVISTIAGDGTFGFSGDGGPATGASLSNPQGVAIDAEGNLYIADQVRHRIRRVTPTGVISTIAGNGTPTFSGDGGPATSASLSSPYGVAVDAAGNLYISDINNQRIRRVTPAGVISTIAGTGARGGFSGDGGPAISANLNNPSGVAVDGAGNLFIADSRNNRIRRVTPAGVISTIAGNGMAGFSGDGGPATSANLSAQGVAVDGAGNLYISGSSRIRRVTPAGVISTIAGNGTQGFSGDGGPATSASLNGPNAVALDGVGNLFISDETNQRIRRVILDSDEDGEGDPTDNCPYVFNADQADSDSDGVGNVCDNCSAVANASQRNTDADRFGNACDADLNNDNLVNSVDLALFRAAFGTSNANADLNGDGAVNSVDLAVLRSLFGRPPGPSGL